MKIQTKLEKNKKKVSRMQITIKFQGKYLTIDEIVAHPDLKDRNLNYDCVYERYRNPKIKTMVMLLRKTRYKARTKNVEYLDNELVIFDFGYHKDLKDNEVFLGHLSEKAFARADFWDNQRLGNGRILSGRDKGKRPYFIQKFEIIDKGWKIV